MSLLTLPTEIVIDIGSVRDDRPSDFETLEEVVHPERNTILSCRDLAALARTCRQLNAAVTPLLYTRDINHHDGTRRPSLLWAAGKGDIPILEKLAYCGNIDLDMICFTTYPGRRDVATFERPPDFDELRAISKEEKRSYYERNPKLANKVLSSPLFKQPRELAYCTPLGMAVESGQLEAVKWLLERPSVDINGPVRNLCRCSMSIATQRHWVVQWTPLHLAICKGHVDIAKLLISSGASLVIQADNDPYPLELVKVRVGSGFSKCFKPGYGLTALMSAARPPPLGARKRTEERTALFEYILKETQIDTEAHDMVGLTALHYILLGNWRNNHYLSLFLARNPVQPSIRRGHLLLAVMEGNFPGALLLLDYIRSKNEEGEKEFTDWKSTVVEIGSCDSLFGTWVHACFISYQLLKIRALKDQYGRHWHRQSNDRDYQEEWDAGDAREKLIERFLGLGADINARVAWSKTRHDIDSAHSFVGCSALALTHNADIRPSTVKLLLSHGADPNLQDAKGFTLLWRLAINASLLEHNQGPKEEQEHSQIMAKMKLLLEHGGRLEVACNATHGHASVLNYAVDKFFERGGQERLDTLLEFATDIPSSLLQSVFDACFNRQQYERCLLLVKHHASAIKLDIGPEGIKFLHDAVIESDNDVLLQLLQVMGCSPADQVERVCRLAARRGKERIIMAMIKARRCNGEFEAEGIPYVAKAHNNRLYIPFPSSIVELQPVR